MKYIFKLTATVVAALSAVTAAPVLGQDVATHISRAQNILQQMQDLLKSIQERRNGSVMSKTSTSISATSGPVSLFDGKSLKGWTRTEFAGGGEAKVEPSFRGGGPAIVVGAGESLSGFNWTGVVPKTNYEITLETMKIEGSDFMCGLTFPVAESHASLILGGWGGGVVGISSIDNQDASENQTTKYMGFSKGQWYKVRLRVTPAKIEAWLDDKQIVDAVITGKKIRLRHGEISRSVPLGFSTYQTSAAFRGIMLRLLDPGKVNTP